MGRQHPLVAFMHPKQSGQVHLKNETSEWSCKESTCMASTAFIWLSQVKGPGFMRDLTGSSSICMKVLLLDGCMEQGRSASAMQGRSASAMQVCIWHIHRPKLVVLIMLVVQLSQHC